VVLRDIGFDGTCRVRDLWKGEDVGIFTGKFEPVVAAHGAGLYRVSLEK
jgi:alpha-galactosidase